MPEERHRERPGNSLGNKSNKPDALLRRYAGSYRCVDASEVSSPSSNATDGHVQHVGLGRPSPLFLLSFFFPPHLVLCPVTLSALLSLAAPSPWPLPQCRKWSCSMAAMQTDILPLPHHYRLAAGCPASRASSSSSPLSSPPADAPPSGTPSSPATWTKLIPWGTCATTTPSPHSRAWPRSQNLTLSLHPYRRSWLFIGK